MHCITVQYTPDLLLPLSEESHSEASRRHQIISFPILLLKLQTRQRLRCCLYFGARLTALSLFRQHNFDTISRRSLNGKRDLGKEGALIIINTKTAAIINLFDSSPARSVTFSKLLSTGKDSKQGKFKGLFLEILLRDY